MSLFDGQIGNNNQKRKRDRTKIKSLPKPRKTGRGEHREERNNLPTKTDRNERRRITEAYKRGELKFEDTSAAFALCRCCQSPDWHNYPHEYHRNEIAKFELETHAKKRRI